ncbi:General secretion pathway protein K [Desulfonema limicola]|uniref:General secretion pathway protein K n=2 Tax=Desulfonema limicola TaxID=45656 RepID=A0A975GEU9_9BACT|nr:General secretion pathway protein K [Desulfonema limicola]
MQNPDIIKNNRGIALLITLGVITVLITGTLEMNRRVRGAVISVAAARDRLTLTQMTSAGVHTAMAMLIADRRASETDSIQEDWANPEKIAEVLQAIPFNKGRVTFSIKDELGKIQVNSLVDFPKGRHFNESQKIMWDRFTRLLLSMDDSFKDIEATAIINSVKDWLDSGDDDATTGLNGAESEYYQGLDPPYDSKNGPMNHIEELMQVKGITPELFKGINEMSGIESFMTVYGMTRSKNKIDNKEFTFEGKININTADLPVLIAMIPSENPEYAQAIFNFRNEKEDGNYINALTGTTWYKNVPDIPGDITIDPKLITVSSDFFEIKAEAALNDMELTARVIVHREQNKKTKKWQCRVLSWQAE